ncbi:hypothetical protein KBK19_13895 [Microvirga sp. STR05]|uniref:Uncharacterized protein n=1 Tax=Hymenobacter duratus TaxID=2771356 RepID=A0ABR8JH07_9BACT|nr:hypothetical protein [Hymenobacter duratus]MBD2716130.1 hypothetical protein [Hymenobacter duratus]MBR7951044.1 hypothetical protein [Microvirga sp. STR05]
MLLFAPFLLLIRSWEWLIARLRATIGWPTGSPPPPPSLISLLRSPKVKLSYLPGWAFNITPPEFADWIVKNVDDEYTMTDSVVQLHTAPAIVGLHQQLIGALRHPWREGILLQLLEATNRPDGPAGTSWLVYLDLETLHWQRLQELKQCQLESTPDAPDVLRGWLEDGSEVCLHVAAV